MTHHENITKPKNYENITLYYRGWYIFPNNGNWCICNRDWSVDDHLTMPYFTACYDYIDKMEETDENSSRACC